LEDVSVEAMNMRRISNLVLLLGAAALPPGLAQWQAAIEIRKEDSISEDQQKEIAELVIANRALSNLAALATRSSGQSDYTLELARLRDQAQNLRGKIQQARGQMEAIHRRACLQFREMSGKLSEHNDTLPCARWVMGKPNDALAITDALLRYAREHEGDFPTSWSQATNYLAPGEVSGTNEFDVVYTGSLRDLSSVPPESIALIREREPWHTKDGKWARVYGFADGSACKVISDDDFKSWDSQYVIPSASSN
jgi:hypothetical protein